MDLRVETTSHLIAAQLAMIAQGNDLPGARSQPLKALPQRIGVSCSQILLIVVPGRIESIEHFIAKYGAGTTDAPQGRERVQTSPLAKPDGKRFGMFNFTSL